ncbi:receptor protein [Trifolium repens]|nr:receptor protein [Trifolium repens]
MCYEGCLKQERQALIAINSQMGNSLSWADNTNTADCCQWNGVECNTINGRIAKLILNVGEFFYFGARQINYSDFIIFKDLKSLDLSYAQISNCTKSDQGLKNLEVLNLNDNPLYNAKSIMSCLDGLSSLKSLSLAYLSIIDHLIEDSTSLHIFQTMLETISSKMLHLEVLDISYNNLTNEILPSLRGFTSLNELYLIDIGLDSDLRFHGLKNLEILDISANNFYDTDIASALSGLSSLKSLILQRNQITIRSIHNISKLGSLELLDLSINNLQLWPLENDGFAWPSSLQVLNLSSNNLNNYIVSSLNGVTRLKSLDLSINNLNGSLDISNISKLRSLEMLHLSGNNMSNIILQFLNGLPHLKSLDLRLNNLNGPLDIVDWSKLKKLEELDLSSNEFAGKLPSSFVNMTSLRTLSLANNHLIGNISSHLSSSNSLQYLNFEDNQFEFPISLTQFSNHSNLEFIYGNGNKVILDSHSTLKTWVPKFQLQVLQLSSINQSNSIPIPKFLLYQYNLTQVDFSGCKLRGEFPNWLLENNTKMEYLNLESCSFIGDFQLPSRPHLNMGQIDVSNNAITGIMLSNNISSILPKLVMLNMSGNAIRGSIPYELSLPSSLYLLDLSDNQLSGQIPQNISAGYGSRLTFLSFSNNKLHGPIPLMLSMISSLQSLFLDGNSLSGSIPRSIPSELTKLEYLTYLDLSQNKLVGCVPSFENSFTQFIHLSDNNLSCLSKNMFGERSSLVTLDLSNNAIRNGFHDLIHDLHHTRLNILLLKGNLLKGNIPNELCHLTTLTMLDLSYNSFVREIPSCFGKMPFENKDPERLRIPFYFDYDPHYGTVKRDYWEERDSFTSKRRSENYTTSILIYMSGIDLSHNKLNGSIPSELGNLTRIRALNWSNNFFTGKIPDTFSNLVQVESLDLSFNMLSGQIPPQISGLISLEVFSVAHNNLSGETPEWKGQFSTFDESSYEGNQFLCGLPLPKSCNPNGQSPATLPNGLNNDEENDSWVDMYVFRVSFAVAYTSMLMVIATVLYINPYWRRAWFYYIGLVGMNFYYFIEDNFCRFF